MRNFFLLFLFCIGLSACGNNGDVSPKDASDMQLATQVSIFESKDNQKQWILLADTVDFADLKSAMLKNPQLLLKQEGKDSARVSGKSGSFDYIKKLVTVEGNAEIDSFTEDVKITANCFFYDVENDRVWSEGKTVITRGGAKITARGGIETDSKLVKIEMKKQSTQLPKSAEELQRKSK
jgi:LPS export ABC transporter protein LptC